MRGAATLKARVSKEVWNIAAVIPVEKAAAAEVIGKEADSVHSKSNEYKVDSVMKESFLDICHQEYLARGSELLKRTRKGKNSSLILNFKHVRY